MKIDVGGNQGRDYEPDLLDDGPLLTGVGVLVWICVGALMFTAWVMFA